MPATRLRCTVCRRLFWASRKDTLYCPGGRCRTRDRQETAKFKGPAPKSGVPGITWNRIIDRWTVKVKLDGKWKYVGSFREFSKAYLFQLEVADRSSR